MDVEALADSLKELGASLRRMALALGFLAARLSSAGSDRVVIRMPRDVRRFKPEPPTRN
jgi:hypothetical protein